MAAESEVTGECTFKHGEVVESGGFSDMSHLELKGHDDKEARTKENGEAIYCEPCGMWFGGPTIWEDHKLGHYYKKNTGKTGQERKGKTVGRRIVIVTPDAIEVSIEVYMLSLYRRSSLRSRL